MKMAADGGRVEPMAFGELFGSQAFQEVFFEQAPSQGIKLIQGGGEIERVARDRAGGDLLGMIQW